MNSHCDSQGFDETKGEAGIRSRECINVFLYLWVTPFNANVFVGSNL